MIGGRPYWTPFQANQIRDYFKALDTPTPASYWVAREQEYEARFGKKGPGEWSKDILNLKGVTNEVD